jgi:putative membrane protein (TIGR04086 family)
MSFNLSNIKWGWVVLGVVIAFVITFGITFCVLTGYSTYLGFQARGVPDTDKIIAFAESYAQVVPAIFIVVGTFVGGLLAGRKAEVDVLQNGLMVGGITAIIDLVFSIIGDFTLWSVVSIILAVGGGWLGGKLASKRT